MANFYYSSNDKTINPSRESAAARKNTPPTTIQASRKTSNSS